MLVCGIITFNLLVIIALLIVAGRYAKKSFRELFDSFVGYKIWLEKKVDGFELGKTLLMADLDKNYRLIEDFKRDIDAKFGPDLIAQLNAIFKLKQSPGSIVIGPDGKTHKINRDY